MKVENGSTVKVHYTGKFAEDGEVFDSSEGKEPIEIVVGEGRVIPGFEKALVGMEAGDKKTVDIAKDDAYGDPDPNMIQEVQTSQLPEGVKEGDMLTAQTPMGPIPVTVAEVNGDNAKVDANHPLAGKDLVFEVELVSIETADTEG